MSEALKKTALNSAHRAAGARMVAFAGWELPLNYGSQVEEHHQVRRDAGMFDVSHMLAVDFEGAGAAGFLRRLLASDVGRLTPGKALYSCMLNTEGGVIDDLIAYFLGEGRFRLVVNAGTADKDLTWFASQRGPATDFAVVPRRDLAMLAVQGPQAREKVWRALPRVREAAETLARFEAAAADGMLVARTGYTGEDGYEIMLPSERALEVWNGLLKFGVRPAGLGARDTLRLEAGMALYGEDMDESVTPFESGLGWTVDLRVPRDFTGRAGTAARPATRQLLGVLLLDRGVMRAHQAVRCRDGEGVITSGGFSPTLGRSIALARVPMAVAAGEEVEVLMRGQWQRGRAVRPPFVRNGRILVGAEGTSREAERKP